MSQTITVRRSIRTSALLCRNDVTRGILQRGYGRDPWTGETVFLATGYPPVR